MGRLITDLLQNTNGPFEAIVVIILFLIVVGFIKSYFFESGLEYPSQESDNEDYKRRKKIGLRKLFIFASFLVIGFSVYSIANSRSYTPESVEVSSYTRDDGTRVDSYNRRPPGSVERDNEIALKRMFFVGLIAISLIVTWKSYKTIKRLKN